nr:unnamed protein product [uncultured bacterium]
MSFRTPKLYNARIKTYPDGRQNITVFSKPIFNPEKWESYDDWTDTETKNTAPDKWERSYNDDGQRLDNIKRSREKVFDIAFANIELWKYMVTFTLDRQKIDRYDADEVRRRFQRWLDNSVQRKHLNYILVAEPHKDGAIHFHGLLSDGLSYSDSGRTDEDGRKIFDVLDYPFGFARAVPIDDGTQSNCCKYITKYMTKDFTKIFGRMYWAGGKLLTRDVKCEYLDMDFRNVPVDGRDVPNGGYSVKYWLKGVTI